MVSLHGNHLLYKNLSYDLAKEMEIKSSKSLTTFKHKCDGLIDSKCFIEDSKGLVRKLYTLVLVIQGDEILLGFKKRGFGKGTWNGFGGKLEKDETLLEGAVREMKEESGLSLEKNNLEQIGILEFTWEGDTKLMEVHVFKTSKYTGELTESDEMLPKWFKHEDVPYDNMWPDDIIWYPLMFKGSKFKGHVHFNGDNMAYDTIKEVDILE